MDDLTFAGLPLTGTWPERCPDGHRLEWVTLDGQAWLMCEKWNCRYGDHPGPRREEYLAAFGNGSRAGDHRGEGRALVSLRDGESSGGRALRVPQRRRSDPPPAAPRTTPLHGAVPLRRSGEGFRKPAWIVAVVVALAAGGLVVAQSGNRVPQYQAEVSILVRPQVIAPTASESTGLSPVQSAYRETVRNNTLQLLRSRTISQRVAERVGGLTPEELARRVTVKDLPGTDFLVIRAVHEQPGQAAVIANAMALELVTFYAQVSRAEATSARKFIDEQLGLAQDRLGAAEQALLEFRTRTGAVALTEESSRTVQRILDLQAASDAAMLDETIARTRVAAIRSHLASQNDGRLASISIATNPVIVQLRDHLTGLELELANLRQMYTEEHPKVQAMLGRIADDRRRLSAEGAKVLTDKSLGMSPIREQLVREMINGEVDAAAARARAAGMVPILGRLQSRLNGVSDNELALVRLQRDVRIAEQLFTGLTSLRQEALIRESKAGSSGQAAITVVDHAIAPGGPVPNQLPTMAAAFAGLLALLVGLPLAVGVEHVRGRRRSRPRAGGGPDGAPLLPRAGRAAGVPVLAQAEGGYGVPVLAAIPTTDARSYRDLTTASGIASTLLLPMVLVGMLLGAGAGLYLAVPDAQRWVEHPRQAGALLTALAETLTSVAQPQGAIDQTAGRWGESLKVAGQEIMQQLADESERFANFVTGTWSEITGTIESLAHRVATMTLASLPAHAAHFGLALMQVVHTVQ